jgi:hypothetical protein
MFDYLYTMNKNEVKRTLLDQLKAQGVFWSYSDLGAQVPDETLIENTLIYLDLHEITLLFKLYPKDYVRKVWKENILTLEPRYHNLNKFIAWFYFKEEI